MNIRDVELIKNINLLIEKKIIIYGVGEYGKRAKRIIDSIEGTKVEAYCESDVEAWKQKNIDSFFKGIQVKSLDELKDKLLEDNYLLIIATSMKYRTEIINKIATEIPELKEAYTWFGLHYSFELNINDSRIRQDIKNEFMAVKGYKFAKLTSYLAGEVAKMLDDNTITIFQPGKVGSASVSTSLNKINVKNAHIHFIESQNILNEKFVDENYKMLVKCWKEKYRSYETIKIITLIREPIARSISAFFQYFDDDFTSIQIDNNDLYISLKDYIKIEADCGKYGYMFEWFNKEIKELFDIDVYDNPFDKEKGYTIIKKNNVELLFLTMEKLNENEETISKFLKRDDFKIVKTNQAHEKDYSYAYKEVLENIKIDKEILDFYYNSNKCMDCFYTQEQKDAFRKRWER